jgi:tRNA threonylcarbamoyladenosine biosynthesis protein TsaB
MKILGIDTTTKFLCLGFYDGQKTHEYSLEVGRKLSCLLSTTIKRLLDALDWDLGDIDYFACGLGPGSFTGLRVGVATIKGLSWATKKPILGIPTLDILAQNVTKAEGYIVPALDAKRNLIYCSIYKIKGTTLKRISPYMLLDETKFYKRIKPNSFILGDAAAIYKEGILRETKAATILDKDFWYIKANNIITLALEKIRGREFSSPFSIKPIYLYPKECQIKKA